MTATQVNPPTTVPDEPTGWTGWVVFAGIMMIIGGFLNAFYGFIAIINSGWVVWTHPVNMAVSLTTWGWVHLLVGLCVAGCGFLVMRGNLVARIVGVVIAGISMLANFFFIPAAPLWAMTVIAVDILVIWALIVHGREMKAS